MSGATKVQHGNRVYAPIDGCEAYQQGEVSASWSRSATGYKIDPASNEPPPVLTVTEVTNSREKVAKLIAAAREELDNLYRIVGRARYVVLLSDEHGVTIDHRGEPAESARFKYRGTCVGGVSSEETKGTNGIGTCIPERRSVTIHSAQHFRSSHIGFSCSVSSIFGTGGELMGTLDISSIDPNPSGHSHGLAEALVIETARAIQERYFREQFRRAWIVAAAAEPDATERAILLAVDKDHQIVGADRNARGLLSRTNAALDSTINFWTLFERDDRLFRANDCPGDISVRLVPIGSTVASPALITPPEGSAAIWHNAEYARLHCRPRLNIVAHTQTETTLQLRGGLPPRTLRRMREYIASHLHETIELEKLATMAGLSLHHFARAFKRSTGVPPHGYVVSQRLNSARDLLVRTDKPLGEIAVAAGFSDQSHLTRQFRQTFGVPPAIFRRSHR